MAKKIFGLIITFLFPLSLVGCNAGINFNVACDTMGVFGYKEVNDGVSMDMLELVRSSQELKDLCVEWNNPAFEQNSESFLSDFSTKLRTYDEEYFSEKVLIIYSYLRGYRVETEITGVNVDENNLVINAQYNIKKGTFNDLGFYWLNLIELSKEDVKDATTVQIVHK